MYLSYPLAVDARVRKHDEALAHDEQAARPFRMTGNVRGQAKLANNQGRVYQSQARKSRGRSDAHRCTTNRPLLCDPQRLGPTGSPSGR